MATGARDRTWLGIDLGTSAVKAVLVAEDGRLCAAGQASLALQVPEPLAAEQSASAWWSATQAAVRACLERAPGAAVAGVGLTGQKHALLLLDEKGQPLAPARLWADGRAASETRTLRERIPDLARRTGAPALPGYLLPKWLRLLAWEPDVLARTAHLLFAKDWLRLCLTGSLATDPTEASASQLWQPGRSRWNADRCRTLGIDPAWLPVVVPSNERSGVVTEEAAEVTGLPAGIPVVGGAGDNEAAALACGAVDPGVVAVILGTSGTVVATATRRGRVGGLVWGRHVTRRGLAATGTTLSAGRAIDWARRAFLPATMDVAEALELAFGVAIEEALPTFVPALVGERSPEPDEHARGAFLGLEPGHEAPQLLRAVVDGVSATLGQIVDLLRGSGVPVEELRFTSGGAASQAWRQAIAAAARTSGRLAGQREGPARGAALLAAAEGATDADLRVRARAWSPPQPLERPTAGAVLHMAAVKARLEAARRALARR